MSEKSTDQTVPYEYQEGDTRVVVPGGERSGVQVIVAPATDQTTFHYNGKVYLGMMDGESCANAELTVNEARKVLNNLRQAIHDAGVEPSVPVESPDETVYSLDGERFLKFTTTDGTLTIREHGKSYATGGGEFQEWTNIELDPRLETTLFHVLKERRKLRAKGTGH